MKRVIITNYTDPVCVWCWGTEPVFRALETHFPELIEFRYVCGGLVENIDQFTDAGNGIDGGADRANRQIMEHWLASADRHGMPIQAEGFHLFSKEYPSTFPQNIAYKAAQIASPELADAYLRRLREATLAEARITSKTEVQIELAGEVGVNVEKFIAALHDESAEKKFNADLWVTRSLGVSGFPTFLCKTSEARQVMVRGFQDYKSLSGVISYLTDGELQPVQVPPDEAVLNGLFANHKKLAREEIYQAFDFADRAQADAWISLLAGKGKVEIQPAGSSYFIRPVESLSCNSITGVFE